MNEHKLYALRHRYFCEKINKHVPDRIEQGSWWWYLYHGKLPRNVYRREILKLSSLKPVKKQSDRAMLSRMPEFSRGSEANVIYWIKELTVEDRVKHLIACELLPTEDEVLVMLLKY